MQRTDAGSSPLDSAENNGEELHSWGEQRVSRLTPPGRVWCAEMMGPDLGRSLQGKFCVLHVCSRAGENIHQWV